MKKSFIGEMLEHPIWTCIIIGAIGNQIINVISVHKGAEEITPFINIQVNTKGKEGAK